MSLRPLSIFALSLALAPLAALPACGGDGGDSTTDVAGTDVAGTDVAPGTCGTVVNGGEQVPETAGVVFFGPSGGTVADGTYHLTEFKVFPPGSVDPFLRRHALRVTGDHVEVVTQTDNGPEQRMTATMTLSGNTVTFDVDCPQPTSYSFGYTASETQFVHIIEGPDIKETHTYTLQ